MLAEDDKNIEETSESEDGEGSDCDDDEEVGSQADTIREPKMAPAQQSKHKHSASMSKGVSGTSAPLEKSLTQKSKISEQSHSAK